MSSKHLVVAAGPKSVTPVVGGIVEMVKDPYGFWEKQRLMSFPGMSWHSLLGVFTIFVTDPAISRHVFSHNSKVRVAESGVLPLEKKGFKALTMWIVALLS